ncbi:CHAT domain-containing tetratricopeptide repeat protein [Aeoliella sp.]|uniref:CHAT domain-containing tetratricopeptide repeat protein n=1 Tax=Aeoliella sp. TaxID=2795800 RepID=UPI003CCB9E17
MSKSILEDAVGFVAGMLGGSIKSQHEFLQTVRRAESSLKTGDMNEARIAYEEAIRLFEQLPEHCKKRNPGAYSHLIGTLAAVLDELEEFPTAKHYHERSIDLVRQEVADGTEDDLDTLALRLRNYGNTLADLKDYATALAAYEESLAIRRKLAAQYGELFDEKVAKSLHVYGRLLQIIGDSERAKAILLEGLEVLAGHEVEFAPTFANTLSSLSVVFADLGDYEAARSNAMQELSVRRSLRDAKDIADCLTNLADFEHKLGDFSPAEDHLNEAIAILETSTQPGMATYDASLSACFNNLGNLLNCQARSSEAEDAFEKAIKIREALADCLPAVYSLRLVNTLSNLMCVKNALGKFEEGRALGDRILQLLERLPETTDEESREITARSWFNLANTCAQMSDFEGARYAFTKAIEIQKTLVADHPHRYRTKLAKSLCGLATVLNSMGDNVAARSTFAHSVTMQRELALSGLLEHLEQLAVVLSNYSYALMQMGDDDESIEIMEEVVGLEERIAELHQREVHRGLGDALHDLGCSLLHRGKNEDIRRGGEVLRQAVEIRRALAGSNSLKSIAELALSRQGLGKLLLVFGDLQHGKEMLRTAAEGFREVGKREPEAYLQQRVSAYVEYAEIGLTSAIETSDSAGLQEIYGWLEEASQIGEKLRYRFLHPGQRRLSSERNIPHVLQLLVICSFEMWNHDKDDEAKLEAAVLYSERGRVRDLLDALQEQPEPINTPSKLVERLRVSRKNLSILADRMQELESPRAQFLPAEGGPGSFELSNRAFEESLEEIKRSYYAECDIYQETINEIRKNYDPLFDPEGTSNDVTVDQLRAALPDRGTVAIQYTMTDWGTVAITLTSSGLEGVLLPETRRDILRTIAERWLVSIGQVGENRSLHSQDENIDSVVREVSDLFTLPLAKRLPAGTRRVLIVPHRELHLIPWNACWIDDNNRLADRYEVWIEPSLAVYCATASRTYAPRNQVFWLDISDQKLEYHELGFARVKSHFDERVDRHTVETVDPSELRSVSAEVDIWHYGGNCHFNKESPLDSLFGQERRSHTLTLRDAFVSLRLPGTRLAFLAACQTGLVNADDLDDHVGFPQAFLRAGARCVISSLWKVHDLATTLLVDRFYWHLSQGLEAGQSLRESQNWLRGVPDSTGDCLANGQAVLDYLDSIRFLDSIELSKAMLLSLRDWMDDFKQSSPFSFTYYWAGFQLSGYPD